jgi:DNA/RNA-binding domain of Phe-tRNA-synthetase-like protein
LGVNGAYFVIDGMKNCKSASEFDAIKNAYFNLLSTDYVFQRIEYSETIRGFRELHDKVNCAGQKFISAPENLMTYFANRKSLPSINLIVDIYNCISLKSELALGAHDVCAIDGDVHLRLTEGAEKFVPLGFSKAVPVKKGEYCYIDDSDEVICRLEVRQVEKTKVTEATTSCFYIVQGNFHTQPSDIISVAKELIELTTRFCGGTVKELYFP